ncbi:MAG: hypothetical protein MJZ67_07970 [Bacteroidales bacterium]|nr:hypothetical protein [Bacteroidales bacterium]
MVVHSHPFASHQHNHNTAQFDTLDQLSNDTCTPASGTTLCQCYGDAMVMLSMPISHNVVRQSCGCALMRAPPRV